MLPLHCSAFYGGPNIMLRPTLLILFLAGCASVGILQPNLSELYGEVVVSDRRVDNDSIVASNYHEQVEPIIEQRCVVCHGCYDAPCQLKLSSSEGIMRGATKQRVYDGTRILAVDPTRIGIDATSTEQWRNKGFFSVLNDRTQNAEVNLENSLFYQMLEQKQEHPLPKDKLLDERFPLGLDRPEVCPTPQEYANYRSNQPLWGMPYALPELKQQEHEILKEWIRKGAPLPKLPELPDDIKQQITTWETFLNKPDNKHQLTARYVFEHTYLANLYFSDLPLFKNIEPEQQPKFFFKMVRSATPPGFPIKPVNARRPYDKPNVQQIYYRLMQIDRSIVHKTHMPYRLNQERLDWINELFIEPEYTVDKLPSYEPEVAANPFIAFEQLPVEARYRFMLQESEFIVQGFIKGPVCRGQIALNVIDDHFWVAFVDPDYQDDPALAEFLSEQSNNLRLPGEAQSNSGIATNWLRYSSLHADYLKAKNKAIEENLLDQKRMTTDIVWDGDGHNPNAALTIMRHFDSSTVVKGWVGQEPKTAWLISYPLLERIHYLLVAEFDVYGNIGHQLMTRLYMDFLRMEGEANFLALLPQHERKRLSEYWYRDAGDKVKEYLEINEKHMLSEPNIQYKSEQPKSELLARLHKKLSPAMSDKFKLESQLPSDISDLNSINAVRGKTASIMPEASILYIEDTQKLYTILRASGHSNLTGLLYEELNRLPEEDYLTILPNIATAYPNAFYRIQSQQAERFAKTVASIQTEQDYEALIDQFGVRRTDPKFWQYSDAIHKSFSKLDPLNYGLLDYNRLENR
ncbi:fatty acid cis/trans isomerase [Bermanella marisrubri]|nr:fatty acid cis/trans isomerase [Bermanella marisrubri]